MNKNKVIVALVASVILLAIGFMALLTYKVATLENNNKNLAVKFELALDKINKLEDGKDGYTPIKGVDYSDGKDGVNGKDGKNSVSTHTSETIVRQEQIALFKDVRINPETKSLEAKLSTDQFWEILIPCEELLVGCPLATIPPVQSLFELGEL